MSSGNPSQKDEDEPAPINSKPPRLSAIISELLKATFRDLPKTHQLGYLLVGIGTMVLPGFLLRSDAQTAIWLYLILIIFALVVFLVTFLMRTPVTGDGALSETYRRVILKKPISQETVDELKSLLDEAIAKAFDILNNLSDLTKEHIRGNVFLPEPKSRKQGMVFHLSMHHSLRQRMEPWEWEIAFAPGEGSTGTAFDTGQQSIAPNRKYMLSQVSEKNIHKDLTWVISTPLKNSKGVTHAILNVDGLNSRPAEAIIEEIAAAIQELAEQSQIAPFFDDHAKSVAVAGTLSETEEQ